MKICIGADKMHSKFNMRNLFVELNEPQNQYVHAMEMGWGLCKLTY